MTNFFISQLKITGSEVRPATLEFKQGANIIYGNSDEGKSYIVECLDFMFGAKNMRLKASSGYSTITMTIVTSEGSIDLVRRFDVSPKKSVSIYTDDARYKSLSCYEQSYEVLGNFWLRLMGFSENQAVITNTYYKREPLTIKNVTSLFLFKETKITSTSSIISSSMRILATLLLMLTGRDYTEIPSVETDAERRQKAKGAKEQLRLIMDDVFDQLQEVIRKIANLNDGLDPETDWNALMRRFEDQEKQLNEAIANSAMLHRQLEELRKRQISYRMQRENQHLLQELYDRQAQRLTFAMEGELLSHQSGNQKCHCPFCGAESESALDENALKATSTEVEQTGIAVRSLQDLDKELDRRMKRHQKKIDELQAQIIALDKEIASAYAPAVAELRSKIAVYLESYSLRQTKDRLMLDYSTWQTKYERFSEPIADSARFKIKEEYPKEFFDAMKDILFTMLHECDLADLKTVDFRAGTMDLSINRQEKNTFGEGYRGILNMAVAFSLFTHLCNKGIYSPGLLIMDSPIQAMNEPAESKLTSNLISYICRNAGCGQVFIIDNEIPADADYADAKVHQIGSEGLLPDFKRPVRKMTQSEAAEQSKHIDGIVTTIPVELK